MSEALHALMVVGGLPNSASGDVEMIHLTNPNRACDKPSSKFPGGNYGMVGAFVEAQINHILDWTVYK